MQIKIGRYHFEGPFSSISNIKEQEGIYVILSRLHKNIYSLLDIGESDNLKTRVEKRKNNFSDKNNKKRPVFFAVNYTQNLGKQSRELIVSEIKYEHERMNLDRN